MPLRPRVHRTHCFQVRIIKNLTSTFYFYLSVISVLFLSTSVSAQKEKQSNRSATTSLTRMTPRHENFRLAYGGTVTIVGAPAGSITIEGWDRNEVDVTADIELRAPSEADLAKVSMVNNFVLDEDTNHIRILTTGTHDQLLMKRLGKAFPKNLSALPWKIDYRLRVPALTDLEVSEGIGPIKLSGVEGALHLNAVESDAVLWLTGGDASITIQRGS